LPSINKVITDEMSLTLLVNGAAIDASASDKLIPASAYFSATQSFLKVIKLGDIYLQETF